VSEKRKYTRRADPEKVSAVRRAAIAKRWAGTTLDERREATRSATAASVRRAAMVRELLEQQQRTA